MPPTFPSITTLMTNETQVRSEAINVLLRISRNILKDPSNPKFRSLSLVSSIVQEKLLTASGALECLFEMGFEEGDDALVFPKNKSTENLKMIHEILQKKTIDPKPQPSTSSQSEKITTQVSPVRPIHKSLVNLDDIHNSLSNQFLKNIVNHWKRVEQYEWTDLQAKALKCIPVLELKSRVEMTIRKKQNDFKLKKLSEENVDCQEVMLCCLIDWFKNEFFSWVNIPECPACQSESSRVTVRKSDDPKVDRVEVYECKKCKKEVLFPRYNDASELLKTRSGRCGEWANCFTLLCRAMGWDARLVHDETDHAWTEVFLNIPKMWVHCDPCEGTVDAPLLYEAGWKKQLSYIIAYSYEEVQDVTWRYSAHHKQLLKRRRLCKERDLVDLIVQIRERCGQHLSQPRRDYVIKRCLSELVALGVEKQATDKDLQGRTSGSEEWRRARQEIGDVTPYTWKIKTSDVSAGKITLGYSSVKDEYYKNGETVKTGFRSGLFNADNVQRKVEKDWKMVYIARLENTESATLIWQFELEPDLNLEKVEIAFRATSFKNGKIEITINSGDITADVPTDGSPAFYPQFEGCKKVLLKAALTGGEGSVAWQHAQLFRTSLNDQTVPLQIIFYFKL